MNGIAAPSPLDGLDPARRASLIYDHARADLSGRLWRAALGRTEQAEEPFGASQGGRTGLEMLLAALQQREGAGLPAPPVATAQAPAPVADHSLGAAEDEASAAPNAAVGLGPNSRHQASLEEAARRTGLPPEALAAIVDAEAAKGRDGSWQVFSRNPRSSAAGLGQFLSGTWIGEAERPGTWLNAAAKARGWLTEAGRVARAARSELLALRYDPAASINATADYARANLDRLRQAGVPLERSVTGIARAAYLGHHLGVGDAIRFLKDGLDPGRARMLLNAQIGSAGASRRIAEAGDARSAHRTWLLQYVERNVRPTRFFS
jgi:hypothetical protein